MTPLECTREADVVDAIASQRWPERADADLRRHVATCAICSDVAEVAAAVLDERDAAIHEAHTLPPAELVWFRAQARARADASRRAARPIAIMQALGLAGATAVVSLLIGLVAYWVWQRTDWLATDWLASLPPLQPIALESMNVAVRGVLLAVGLWLLLAPVAVYLVASDD
jgi:hypothetical protein